MGWVCLVCRSGEFSLGLAMGGWFSDFLGSEDGEADDSQVVLEPLEYELWQSLFEHVLQSAAAAEDGGAVLEVVKQTAQLLNACSNVK